MIDYSTTFAPAAAVSGNSLIDRLAPEDYERLRHLFRPVELQPRQSLYAPGDRVTHAYFPAGAVATSVATMDDGSTAETAMIGRDGVVGVGTTAGETRSLHWTRVLMPGEALRVETGALREIIEESPAWRDALLRYYGVLIGQVSRRAICNARHRLNERFSTWLLMLRDRASDGDFPLTQETIARQLGVRRAGVNECVVALQRLGVLDHRRGHIRVLRGDALEESACSCYPACREEVRWAERGAGRAVGPGTVVH
ncbi:MAG TPA: Crp/Fnr family transcriptional regulator [Pyrinomonadaceae bacterium]|nr:Crp/Fnr family transcriptional regulator [Pyrinomonadaceae bacterium]